MNKIKYIFFDLDDTLIDSTQIYKTCYHELGLFENLEFNAAKEQVKRFLPKRHTSAHNRLLYFKRYLDNKMGSNPSQILELCNSYEELLTAQVALDIKKTGILTVLKKLKKYLNLAVITNENCRTQLLKLNQIDPHGEIFDFIVTSEEYGAEKPNLKLFREALKRSNTLPGKVLMVGDSFKNDIEPALLLGMNALQSVQFVKVKKVNGVKVIYDLKNLLDL